MKTRTWITTVIILCLFVLSACNGQGEVTSRESIPEEVRSSAAESSKEQTTAVTTEKETEQGSTPAAIEQEVFYYPFIATDAGDIEPHSEHGLRGYGDCLGDAFKDEGQWNGYIIYCWDVEDKAKPAPSYDGRDMAAWMEELGLTVVKDYPYCAYYVETNGAPEGYTADQLSVYAECIVAAPESRMIELFGKDSPAVHGFWLRILPAMDPSLPYPEWYDPAKTYYYRGEKLFQLTLDDMEGLDGKAALRLLEINGLELDEYYASNREEAAEAVAQILLDLKEGRTDPEMLYSSTPLISLHKAVKAMLGVPDRLQLYHIQSLVAEKGEKLSWEDLEQYEYAETGEGSLVREYSVGTEKEYVLVVKGKDSVSAPEEIDLYLLGDGVLDPETDQHIDIRYEDLAKILK